MPVKNGIKVNVLTPFRSGGPYSWGHDLTREINKCGFAAKHIHRLPELLTSPFYQQADVVHTTIPLSCRLWRKPVILTVCGEYTCENNIWRFFTPMAIKMADVVTTPSHFLQQRLKLKDAIVIPNAISPEEFKQVKHSDKDTINLVTVTNFYFREKASGVANILELLENASGKVERCINYSVIGGGPYLKQVTAASKPRGINVRFLGSLPNPRKILEDSDIFLYSSYLDNFPIAILEAMASGLPVITNNVGAVEEMIETGKDGFIAPNEGLYLDYLLQLVETTALRARVGDNARKKVEAKFSWERVIDDYFAIYEKFNS